MWMSYIPYKIKIFAWTAALNWLNTNWMSQIRRPNDALSLDACLIIDAMPRQNRAFLRMTLHGSCQL